jgi:hypothetical protein
VSADLGPSATNPGILLERSLEKLCSMGPLIKFSVTATLLAIYLMLKRMQSAGRSTAINRIAADDIIYIRPTTAYVGTECFQPLMVGQPVQQPLFLSPNELSNRNDFCSRKSLAMYDDAAQHNRALLLDVTSPAVTAAGNIYTKASALLRRHPRALAIVVSGREIWRKCGHDAEPADPQKKQQYVVAKTVSGRAKVFQTVLTEIDLDFPNTPIYVFGYSQMQRGISYRSRRRVPSHMILQFGKAMSLCRLVQAAGRANGKQAQQLMENMGLRTPIVKLLTNSTDFDAIRNYPAFLEAIRRNMQEHSMTLGEALRAEYSGRFDPSAANHPVGAQRAGLQASSLNFHEVSDEELTEHLPGERYNLLVLPGMQHALLRVLAEGGVVDPEEEGMSIRQIVEELNATSDYDALIDSDTLEQYRRGDRNAKNALIRATLEAMNRSRLNIEPLVERGGDGRTVQWAITDRGEYILMLKEQSSGSPDPNFAAQDATGSGNDSRGLPMPMVARQLSAHEHRLSTLGSFENADDLFGDGVGYDDSANDPPSHVPAGSAPNYAFVTVFPPLVMRVMLGCLGQNQPATFSRLFCPLIFLAINPSHEAYNEAMTFWGNRFSQWFAWVAAIRQALPPNPIIEVDEGGTNELCYGLASSVRIPHYTADAQEAVLAAAEVAAQVDACAQMTFSTVENEAGPVPYTMSDMSAAPALELADEDEGTWWTMMT